jgi:zinc transport system ATP-binding protein
VAESLRVGYDGRAILPPLDFTVGAGEVWALIGRNGSGKSTLLRTLLRQIPCIDGHLEWAPDVRISHVPQRGEYGLDIPARVVDIVEMGLDRSWSFLRPMHAARLRGRAHAAMELTDCVRLGSSPFAELSEGQKQRVLLARALASDPDVILLDEPTSAMDPMNETAAFELLARVRQERGVSLVVASHQMSHLPRIASHAVFVDLEDQVVLTGRVADVVGHRSFLRRYGRSDHLPCEHDDDLGHDHAHVHDHHHHAEPVG